MDVRLLEAFRAVVDHRSVTHAAAAMGVTQPAVSAQIARLEQELGFSLFDRSNGRLKPTAEGMLFYAEADKALTGIDRLTEAARQIRTAQSGGSSSPAIRALPSRCCRGWSRPSSRERPGVLVRLLSRNSDVISRLLPTESYDIGIAELPVDEAAVRLTRFRMRCVAILPAGHPLSRQETLSPALLSGHPCVALARTLQTSVRVVKAFAEAGAEWSPVAEAEYFASVCGLVGSGAGWSIVEPLSARAFQHLGFVVRAFEPAIHYEIGVFCARDREPSILAQSFMGVLADKLDTLVRLRTPCAMHESPDLAAQIAADNQLWPDFLAICDCGGRLAGTDSEARAFALVESRAEAATGTKGRSIPVPYGGWSAKKASLSAARRRDRHVPSARAQRRHAARRPDGRGRRSRPRHAGGDRGARGRTQGPHRAGAARADVRRRHHPPPTQVPWRPWKPAPWAS